MRALRTLLPLALAVVLVSDCTLAQQPGGDALSPVRTVADNSITSSSPALKLSVAPKFHYAGARRFILYGVAEAEIHLFVEADANKNVQRMYWVQFEGYLPSNAHS